MSDYKENLKNKMDEYLHFVYDVTDQFPKQELYVSVSQWRRTTLSIILNYVEGYARIKPLLQLNFLRISYGSLKESRYLLDFSRKRDYISQKDYEKGLGLADEIGAMLWTEIVALERAVRSREH
jgi:four helix bundle protein